MMETSETIQRGEKKPRKIRSPFDKEGSFKYLQKWLRRVEDKVDEMRRTQRRIVKGLDLAGQMIFDRTYLEEQLHLNEVDVHILGELYDAGEDGRLPRDVAQSLNDRFHSRRFQPWHVRYVLHRLNRELEAQIGESVAEKRGMQWALTPVRSSRDTSQERMEASLKFRFMKLRLLLDRLGLPFWGQYYHCRNCGAFHPKNTAKISGFNSQAGLEHVHCPRCNAHGNA